MHILKTGSYACIVTFLVHFLSLLPQFFRKLVDFGLQSFAEVFEGDNYDSDVVH